MKKKPRFYDTVEGLTFLVTQFYLDRIPLTAKPYARYLATKEFGKRFVENPPDWFWPEVERLREANVMVTDFVDAIAPRLREYGKEAYPDLMEKSVGPFLDD